MNSDKLKPCPFCGSTTIKLSNEEFGTGQFQQKIIGWWIQCQGESCYAIQQGSSMEKVINRWNKRTE